MGKAECKTCSWTKGQAVPVKQKGEIVYAPSPHEAKGIYASWLWDCPDCGTTYEF